jgi:hypothetical protein
MSGFRFQGLQLYVVDTATTAKQLGNITGGTLPSPSTPEISTTNAMSTGEESIGGIPDFGEVPIEVNYDPGIVGTDSNSHQFFMGLALSPGTIKEYIIGLGDGTDAPTVASSSFSTPPTTRTWVKFNAWVKGMPIKGQNGQLLTTTVTLRCTNAPTFYYKV